LFDIEANLSFRIEQHAPGPHYGECLRVISVNGNLSVAHAAFQAAVREFPNDIWMLVWGMQIIRRYEPGNGENR
jgi:hypothetical protein